MLAYERARVASTISSRLRLRRLKDIGREQIAHVGHGLYIATPCPLMQPNAKGCFQYGVRLPGSKMKLNPQELEKIARLMLDHYNERAGISPRRHGWRNAQGLMHAHEIVMRKMQGV